MIHDATSDFVTLQTSDHHAETRPEDATRSRVAGKVHGPLPQRKRRPDKDMWQHMSIRLRRAAMLGPQAGDPLGRAQAVRRHREGVAAAHLEEELAVAAPDLRRQYTMPLPECKGQPQLASMQELTSRQGAWPLASQTGWNRGCTRTWVQEGVRRIRLYSLSP